jgi:hypothetical protein
VPNVRNLFKLFIDSSLGHMKGTAAAQSFSSNQRFAPLPERDRSVPDCFLRAMDAFPRASDGPNFTLHGPIDRFNELDRGSFRIH